MTKLFGAYKPMSKYLYYQDKKKLVSKNTKNETLIKLSGITYY